MPRFYHSGESSPDKVFGRDTGRYDLVAVDPAAKAVGDHVEGQAQAALLAAKQLG